MIEQDIESHLVRQCVLMGGLAVLGFVGGLQLANNTELPYTPQSAETIIYPFVGMLAGVTSGGSIESLISRASEIKENLVNIYNRGKERFNWKGITLSTLVPPALIGGVGLPITIAKAINPESIGPDPGLVLGSMAAFGIGGFVWGLRRFRS
ncbi:MAG: hypothetical protein ACD_30C00112G0054 [uncultured bacterium]|uniref:Uncharacterized protein n=4 Tax=Candidatus Daviesiibacteriota TaxID=1752718 RepID=A0A0G0FAF1_9BACT|nr:MAG: hypothetical protein ACD_30C00112G0054 [uncultured bacterium]KKQ10525.1 MAG: hypothetical protein US19_C0003G0020 [Candidatus Daviesbacteria bacterium GW2011_GWB1_36_5]KKQ15270.1 MAG: hypothetical protein US28_C0019G0003 [Candidatus Daviesbacteria bacterium GW2011_GWA1_36_8]OGE17214.1 MAG: hypothetical protein A2858_00725 [Candidatus Daviesbacteria bacterium RIFCSPHIGHO2_01_FULL_36_37]OGE35995.1 MAG: hypothetical protein A3E66_01720 [Candidatus Daviesbacteria bacterium RIFCSPHIGHO2_12_F